MVWNKFKNKLQLNDYCILYIRYLLLVEKYDFLNCQSGENLEVPWDDHHGLSQILLFFSHSHLLFFLWQKPLRPFAKCPNRVCKNYFIIHAWKDESLLHFTTTFSDKNKKLWWYILIQTLKFYKAFQKKKSNKGSGCE